MLASYVKLEDSETVADDQPVVINIAEVKIYGRSFNDDLLPSAEFFTMDPDNARRLFSTYLITDLKKYVKELLLHGKSSMIMNCPKKDPFCHYIEDELIV
eukprot:sb/3478563/